FNFILAFFIFLLLGLMQGVPTFEPTITEVQKDSPAYAAGMRDGDTVTAIEGEEITKWPQLAEYVQNHPNDTLTFVVERDGEELTMDITPNVIEEAGQQYGQIGVLYSSPIEKSPLKAVGYGAQQTWEWFVKILELLGMLVTGQFTIDALSGPVGLYKATEEVAQYGVFNLMHWAAILSINLGIMNLLPLPALDGGLLLIFGFEVIRVEAVDKPKEVIVHFIVIVLLMIFMVVVTWNDIQRFFFNGYQRKSQFHSSNDMKCK